MPVELHEYDGDAVRSDAALRVQLAEVYHDAFSEPPYRSTPESALQWAHERLAHQAGYPAFRLVTAQDADAVIGFGYGLLGADDQWFTQTVRARLSPELAQRWLGGHAELVELAVRAQHRGRGWGGRLHDAVVAHLADAGARTALLVVDEAAPPARALYAGRGWLEVAAFSEGSVLMGLRLGGAR